MAKEAGVDVSFDTWDRLSRDTPTLVKLAPSGPMGRDRVRRSRRNVPAVMKALGDLIHPETVDRERHRPPESWSPGSGSSTIRECIHNSRRNPVAEDGSVYILKGSLAPGGAVVKASGVAREMWEVVLPACVFEDEESAIDALRNNDDTGRARAS